MLHEVSFLSYNKRDQVQGWIYVPACEPVGIVQLIHGFGEHSRRYFHMIVAFMDAGFIVAADDHVGHGKTAQVNGIWSDWGDQGPSTMMEDEHTLTQLVKATYPDIPYFLFGHSMGSFIARQYMAKYGDELTGATICGTAGVFAKPQAAVDALKQAISEGRGEAAEPEMTGLLLGWMCERIEEPIRFGNEWICHDSYVQEDHANDPFDAFTKPTTNRSLYDFTLMMDEITGPEWAEKVPSDLPILNIAGDRDPVGNYGEGVYQVSNWLIRSGNDVTTKLFSGYRHEIHNYEDIKDEVEDEIITFMEEALGLYDDEDEEDEE